MPELNPKAIRPSQGYTGPTIPDYNLGEGFKQLGADDTQLGRLIGKNYYDEGFYPYSSQQDQRYANQGKLNAAGNTLAAIGSKTFLVGIPSILGTATSLLASPLALAKGTSLSDVFENNPLNQFANYVNKTTDELTPRFQKSDFNSLGFVEQLARPGELLTANADSLAFMAQSFVPAAILSKAALGAKVMDKLAKSREVYQALSTIKGANLAAGANAIDFTASLALLSTNEAALEAVDAKKQVTEKLNTARWAGKNNYSDEQIDEIANKGFQNVFWNNMVYSTITNGVFQKMLMPMYRLPKATRANELGLRLVNGVMEAPKYDRVTSFLFDKTNVAGAVTKALAADVFTEGIEESTQYSIQNAAAIDDKYTSFGASFGKVLSDIASGEVLNMSDKERAKAAGLGALMGAGAAGVRSFIPTTVEDYNADGTTTTKRFTIGAAAEAKKLRDERQALVGGYNKAYTDLIDHSYALRKADETVELSVDGDKFFKTTPSGKIELKSEEFQQEAVLNKLDPQTGGTYTKRGEYEIDDEGRIKPNSTLINHITNDAMESAELSDYMDLERASGNPDRVKQTIYRNMLVANLAHQAFKSGSTDILLDHLDTLVKGDAQKLADFGLSQDDAQTGINQIKDYVTRLEAIYNTGANTILPTANTEKGHRDADMRRRAFYRKASRAASLDSLIVELDQRTDEIKQTIIAKNPGNPNTEERLAKLVTQRKLSDKVEALLDAAQVTNLNAKESSRVQKELEDIGRSQADLQDLTDESTDSTLAQYVSNVVKRDALVGARESLGKEVDRILSSKNWKASPTEVKTPIEYSSVINPYEGMSSKVYSLHEDRAVRKELLKDQFDRVRSDVHADLIEQIILDAGVETPVRAEDLSTFVNHVIDDKIQLDDSTKKLLDKYILELVNDISQAENKVVTEFNANIDDLINIEAFTPDQADYATDPALALDQKQTYEDLQQAKRALGPIYIFPSSVINKIDDAGKKESYITDYRRRLRIADKQLIPAQSIISTSKFNPPANTIDENYTDLSSVEFELKRLDILIPIFEELGYTSAAADAKYTWSSLRNIKDLVIANLHNKELVDRKETEHYANGFTPLYYELQPTLTLTAAQRDLLDDLIANDPYSASLIISDLVSALPASKNFIDLKKTELAQDFKAFYKNLNIVTSSTQLSSFGDDIFNAFVDSPVKVFTKILSELARKSTVADAALDKFSKDLGISKFMSAVSNLTDVEKTQLVGFYTRAVALNQLSFTVDDAKDSMYFLSTMDKYIQEQKDNKVAGRKFGFPPSFGQERVIRELLIYNSGETKKNVELFDNVIAIKALPGAGKSSVIAPASLKLLGITPSQVLTAANKQEAATNIATTTSSAYAARTIKDLTENLRAGDIAPEISTIIVDEIGGASMKDVYELATAFALFQNSNMDRDIRMWVIYDPNQTNTSQFGQPRIEYDAYTPISSTDYITAKNKVTPTAADLKLTREYETGVKTVGGYLPLIHNMQSVTPMITSYRSNVAMIVDTMNEFLSSSAVTRKLDTATSTTLNSPKDIQGVYAQSFSPQARVEKIVDTYLESSAVNSARSRIIVVGNDAKKSIYTKALPSAKVLTAMEAAGMSVSEVYIDIDTTDSPDYTNSELVYNQALFTAISRAQDFVMLTNKDGSNDVDSSINQKALDTASRSEANFDGALARKQAQIKAYKEFFGISTPTPVVTPITSVPTGTFPSNLQPNINKNGDDEYLFSLTDTNTNKKAAVFGLTVVEVDGKKYLDIGMVSLRDEYQGQGIGTKMYFYILANLPAGIDGIISPKQTRVNDRQVPKIHNRLRKEFVTIERPNGDVIFTKERVTKQAPMSSPAISQAVPIAIQDMDDTLMQNIIEDVPPSDPPVPLTLNNADHILRYPQTDNLQEFNADDEVYVIRDNSNGQTRYVLAKPSGTTFVTLGILGDEELSDFEAATGVDLNSLVPFTLERDPRYAGNFRSASGDSIETNRAHYAKLYFVGGSHGVRYKYANESTYSFDTPTIHLFDNWARQFFSDPKTDIANYTEVQANPADFLKVRIFTEREAASIGPAHKPYQPYLVISGLKSKRGTIIKDQYLKLRPTVFNVSGGAANSIGFQNVQTLTSNLNRFTTKLSDFYGPTSLYGSMRPGIQLAVDGDNIYSPFAAFVRALATETPQVATDEYNARAQAQAPQFVLPPTDYKGAVPQEIIDLAKEIYLSVHSALDKQDYKGPAQLAYNRLAATNFSVTLPNGELMVLRDYPGYAQRNGINYAVGKSLIGRANFEHNDGRSVNPIPSPKFAEALTDIVNGGSTKGQKHVLLEKLLTEINKGTVVHMPDITLEQLNELFVNGVDAEGNISNVSEGFGLRTPLNFQIFGKDMRLDDPNLQLSGYLETTFESVTRPTVMLSSVPGKTIDVPSTTASRVLSPTDTFSRYLRASIEAGKTKEETLKAYTGALPYQADVMYDAMLKDVFYTRRSTVITSALRRLGNIAGDLKSKVTSALEASKDITDRGNVGSRDYLRAMIMAHVFQITNDSLLVNLDKARKFWIVERNDKTDTELAFDEALREEFDNYVAGAGISEFDFGVRLADIKRAFSEVLTSAGITHSWTATRMLDQINEIVLATSAYRTPVNSGARPIEITLPDTSLDVLKGYQELVENNGAASVEAKKYFKDNKELLERYGITPRMTDVDVSSRVDQLIVERSMAAPSGVSIELDITEEEGKTLYNTLNPPTLFSSIRNLFNKGKGEVFNMVSAAHMQNRLGKNNWGLFKQGIIYVLAKNGKTSSKVIRHETFHKAFWSYLTAPERIKVLELARERYGNQTQIELEEALANDFMNYVTKPKSIGGRLAQFFRKLLRFFGFTYNNLSSLEILFDQINGGLMSKDAFPSIERDLAERWPTNEQYNLAKNAFFSTFEHLFYEARNNPEAPLYSFDEAVDATITELQKRAADPSTDPILASALEVLSIDGKAATAELINKFFYSTNVKALRQGRITALKRQKRYIKENIEDLRELDTDIESAPADTEDQLNALEEDLLKVEASINEETIQSDLANPNDKISGRVKQRLISVAYRKNNRIVKGDYYSVFNALLPMLSQADVSSLGAFEASIYSSIKKYRNAFAEEVPSNVRKAAAKFMDEMFTNIKRFSIKAPKTAAFFKDVSTKLEYLVVSLDGSDVRNITRTLALANPSRYKVIDRIGELGESTYQTLDSFVIMASGLTELPIDQLRNSYYLFEELSFLKSLIGSVASLVKSNSFVATSKYENYKYISNYAANRMSGASSVLETQVVDSLVSLGFKASQSISTPLLNASIQTVLRNGTSIQKINSTLALLDLPSIKESDYTSVYLDQVAESLSISLRKLDTAFRAIGAEKSYSDIYELIQDEGTLTSTISDLLTSDSSATEINNFIRGDGKRAYTHRDASYQSGLLNFFSRKNKKAGKQYNYVYYNEKGQLTTDSVFAKNNLFVTGGNSIGSFIDHDSIKIKGREKRAKYLHSEGPLEHVERTFKYGFLDRIRSSKTNKYYQFLPIPANRRTISALEVSILSAAEAKAHITTILRDQMNRPVPTKENGLSNVANYAKRYQKWTFPGLEGKISGTLEQAVDKVLKHIETQAANLADGVNTTIDGKNMRLDDRSIDAFVHTLLQVRPEGFLLRKEYDAKMKDLRTKRRVKGVSEEAKAAISTEIEALEKKQAAAKAEVVKKAATLFYYNHAVNQYSLSQLVYGDEVFYKSKEDQTKRIQGATGTGDTHLVDPVHGLPNVSLEEYRAGRTELAFANRVVVMDDIVGIVPSDLEFTRLDSYRDSFEETDAQGYLLPELYEQYAKAAGVEANTDLTLKPLYYNVTKDGVPELIKFSLGTISDDFTQGVKVLTDAAMSDATGKPIQFLVDLRNKMRKSNAGMLVFSSGVKLGRPTNTAKILDSGYAGSHTGDEYFHEDNIMTIDNNFLRFQLNPSKEVDVDIANPSQLTAFVNTNGQSKQESDDLYRHNASMIRLGQLQMDVNLGISPNGHITNDVIERVRYEAGKATSSTAGSEVVHQMLVHTDANGEYTASLNNPLIQDKFVSVVSSMATSSTVGFRVNGSKLVLQAEFGTYSAESSRLKWKDEEGYTEVLLPESYKEFFKEGDSVGMSTKKNIVGFRIPSSNLHSGIALKVKGFYKVPPNAEGNVIIAPSLVVYVMGSDYDIDTLFVIRKETSTKDVDLNEIIKKYQFSHADDEHFNVKVGQDFGTTDEGINTVKGLSTSEYLESVLYNIYIELHNKNAELKSLQGPSRKAVLAEIKTLKSDFSTLNKYAQIAGKNSIVHTFADVLLAEKNRTDINTPISLSRVTRAKGSVRNELMSLMRKDEFTNDLVTAGMMEAGQFSTEELVTMASSGDLTAITPQEPTVLAQKILAKYDWTKLEDSVMEILANQSPQRDTYEDKYLTNEQVDALLYPPGQLTDFTTQQAIHTNTYSGLKLTGIAANSAKTIAYVFAMADNEVPKLKQSQHLRINKGVYDSFSKIERVWKGEWVNRQAASRVISIFETLDTILNLAIDNVKEQKLSFIGITNNNANLFLTSLAYGVPLNTVSRMFTSSIMKELSSKGRITTDSINAAQFQIIDNLTEPFLERALSDIGGDFLDIKNRISSLMEKRGIGFAQAAGIIVGQRLFVSDDVLDSIARGTASVEATTLHNFVLLEQMKGLVATGEELFKYSQILGLLRSLPNTKWKMDYIAETVLNFLDSPDLKKVRESTKALLVQEHIENFKATSDLYENSDDATKEKLVALEKDNYLNSSAYKASVSRAKDVFITNAIYDKQSLNEVTKSDTSVFSNVSLNNVPHVMEAFKSLQKIRRVLESALGLHSPVMKQFAKSIYEEANVAGTYINNEQFELIQKELIRLLSSDLKFNIYGDEVDLSAPKNVYHNVPATGVTLEGHDAESQLLAIKLKKAKLAYPNNFFLQNIEIATNSQGVYMIGITADKSKEEEVTLELQAAFDDLMRTDETKKLALSLFKHEIVNRGLLFGRTAFSLLFPPVFLGAFTKALDARLDNILGAPTEVATKRLNNIRHSFMLQYLKNNPETVRFLPKYKGAYPKPVLTGYFTSSGGSNVEYYSGVDNVNGRNIYYDLKYDLAGRSPEAFYNIIKTFGEETYIKTTSTDTHVYYRLFTKKGISKHYKFSDAGFSTIFDLKTYSDPKLNVVKNYNYLNANQFISPMSVQLYSEGETLYLVDNYASVPEKLIQVEITKAEQRGARTIYSFKTISSISLLKDNPVVSSQSKSTYFLTKDTTRMANLNQGVAVDASSVSRESDDAAIADITALKDATLYFIDPDLLEPFIANDPKEAIEVAQALLNKTGYTHPILRQEPTDQERLYNHYRNTVLDVKSKLTDVGGEIVSTGVEYGELGIGDVVWLGVNEDGMNIYGRTLSIGNGVTRFEKFNQSVFNSIESSNITEEELALLKQQTHC